MLVQAAGGADGGKDADDFGDEKYVVDGLYGLSQLYARLCAKNL